VKRIEYNRNFSYGGVGMKKLPIGISDFKKIIDGNYFYADKTMLINDLLENGTEVTLFTRPRRFGKTLNMSMLYYYFDIKNAESNKKLFCGLNIEKSEVWNEQGKYPVIFISFKNLKTETWEECYRKLKDIVIDSFGASLDVYETLNIVDKQRFENIIKSKDEADFEESLKYLSRCLCKYYNKKVIVIIDEYDTPIISAHVKGYYKKAISFFRNFYSAVMKDNEYLQFAIMTGIMRVAKEGIFSGLNNLDVYTILEEKFSDSFGLTENDVHNALKEYKLAGNINKVKEWYNGYRFWNYNIYNPWSIIKYLNTKKLGAYWVNTSDNYLINEVLSISNKKTYENLTDLFNGIAIKKYIKEEMVFTDLRGQDSIWTLLLFSGYLTISEYKEKSEYLLKIPNNEIYSFFENSFIDRFTGDNISYFNELIDSLKANKIIGKNSFEDNLREIFLANTSYHDTSNEGFYHGFMLAILFQFRTKYISHSNKESGLGRADLILEPFNKEDEGYIFEFKVAKSEKDIDKKLDEAIKQMEDKRYRTLLSESGVTHVLGIAIAFYGKELKVRYKELY
jgi:hypothetical protein